MAGFSAVIDQLDLRAAPERLEGWSISTYIKLSSLFYYSPASARITLIQIDASNLPLRNGGSDRWPIPRDDYVALFSVLDQMSPTATFVDVLFDQVGLKNRQECLHVSHRVPSDDCALIDYYVNRSNALSPLIFATQYRELRKTADESSEDIVQGSPINCAFAAAGFETTAVSQSFETAAGGRYLLAYAPSGMEGIAKQDGCSALEGADSAPPIYEAELHASARLFDEWLAQWQPRLRTRTTLRWLDAAARGHHVEMLTRWTAFPPQREREPDLRASDCTLLSSDLWRQLGALFQVMSALVMPTDSRAQQWKRPQACAPFSTLDARALITEVSQSELAIERLRRRYANTLFIVYVSGARDEVKSPVHGFLPGGLVHAQALANLIDSQGSPVVPHPYVVAGLRTNFVIELVLLWVILFLLLWRSMTLPRAGSALEIAKRVCSLVGLQLVLASFVMLITIFITEIIRLEPINWAALMLVPIAFLTLKEVLFGRKSELHQK